LWLFVPLPFLGTIQRIGLRLEKLSGKKQDNDFAVVSNPEFLREGTAVKDFYDPPFTLVGSFSAEATKKARALPATSKPLSTKLRTVLQNSSNM